MTHKYGEDCATLDNWLSASHNFWSFRNVDQIVPCDEIAVGTQVLPLDDTKIFELSTKHQDFLRNSRTDSLVVVRGQDLVYQWCADGVSLTDRHLIFSVTKSVTAVLVGALVTHGLLDAEALATKYLPELANSGFAGATIRNLLDMTADYEFVEDYSPGPDILAYRHAAGWYRAPDNAPTLREFIASRKPSGQHGTRFRYLSPTTDLLGWICEQATQSTYSQALSKYVWQPMGAQYPATMTVDREGSPRAAGGLSCTITDLARIGIVLRDGNTNIFSEEFRNDIFRNGNPGHWASGDFSELFANGCYRSCCYRPGEDPEVILGIGIYGQMLYIDRIRNVVVAKQSSWAAPDETTDHLAAYALCRELSNIACSTR